METYFGQWVKRRRRALDLTQGELAHRVGCSLSTISKIETDERRPSRQIAELLAIHLEIPPDQRALFLQVARREKNPQGLSRVTPLVPNAPQPAAPTLLLPKPLVGRESELAEITRLIQSPECRMLTLIGQGGVGKTHLAMHLAQALANSASQPAVTFVNMAAVTGRDQAVTAMAIALGIVLYGAADRAEQLIAYLKDREHLLILDTFDHMIQEKGCVDLVRDILREANRVKILATSREALQLQSEWVFEVQGLPVPQSGQPAGREPNSAEKLFIQRAAQARVGFAPDRADLAAIGQICRLVEGLPLAIELAAAWVRTLTCGEIAEEIRRSLDFLATSSRDLPERHRSIRAAIAYSWELLTAGEERVLRELSIFRGGFTRQAAEQIAGASLQDLSALVSKSLVRRSAPGRYDLHELIRQYTLEQFQADSAENQALVNRYIGYYANLLNQRGPKMKGMERPAVMAELLTEIANLRQAWNLAATRQYASEISRSADTLFWLYESRSNCREGAPLFDLAVQSLRSAQNHQDLPEGPDSRLALGQALSYKGYCLFRQGQHPQGREALSASLRILETVSESEAPERAMAASNATVFLGAVTCVMGDYGEGERLLREGLAQKQRLNDLWGAAFCLRQIGLAAYHYRSDFDQAQQALNQSLAISQQLQNSWSIAASLSQLGVLAYQQGDYEQAEQQLNQALELSRSLDDRASIAFALDNLGLVLEARGSYEEGLRLLEESLALWSEIGEKGSLAHTHTCIGDLLLKAGKAAQARSHFRAAIAIASQAQSLPALLEGLTGEAEVDIATGAHESALLILTVVILNSAGSTNAKARAEYLRDEIEPMAAPETRAAIQERASRLSISALVDALLNAPDGGHSPDIAP